MALPPVGVRLVAQDATGFDSALKTAGSVLDGFGKTATAVTSTVNSAFSGMAGAVGNALEPIGKLLDHIFVSVIRSVVNDAIHAIERFARSVVDAALEGTHLQDSIERLGSSLNSVANSAFKPFTDKLGQLVDQAAPAFLGIVQAAESYLGGLGVNALAWGQNFITQFASGMWAGVGEILQVLTEIANLVTYWLSPGSPPKLLPEIDKWGTAAAGEYFGGWTKGAFSWFADLSGTLSNLIRSIPLPKGEQSGVIPSILGARQGIAAAVEELRSTGKIATSTIDAITAAVGTSDTSVRAYLESMVRLQAANATTKAAQDELNKVTEKYNELIKPVNAEIDGITEAQQQLADEQKKSLLQLVLKDPGASASEKRQAALEIERLDAEKNRRALLANQKVEVEAAKDKLDAAKTAEQLAQDDFDAKKALIVLQTEQNNLMKEQLRLLESLNKIGGGAGGAGNKPPAGGGKPAITPFKITPPDFSKLVPPDILGKWDSFVTAFEALWKRITEVMQPAVDTWNNTVVPAWNRLRDAFVTSIPMIESNVAQMVAFTVQELGIVLVPVLTNVASAIDSLTQIWTNHGATIMRIITFVYKIVVAILGATAIFISGEFAAAMNGIAGYFDTWSLIFQGDWQGAWDKIGETYTKSIGIWQTTFTGMANAILAVFGLTMDDLTPLFNTLKTWLDTTLTAAIGVLSTAWTTTLKPAIEAVLTWMQDPLFPFLTSIADLIGAVFDLAVRTLAASWKDTLQPALETVHTFMVDKVLPIFTEVEKFLRETFAPIFATVNTAVQSLVDGAFTALKNIVDTISQGLRDATGFIQGLIEGINSIPSLPGFGGSNTNSQNGMSSNTVNGPPAATTSGGASTNSTVTNYGSTYAPTYVSSAPPPSAGFAAMTALFA